jgi:hypothetical protein
VVGVGILGIGDWELAPMRSTLSIQISNISLSAGQDSNLLMGLHERMGILT